MFVKNKSKSILSLAISLAIIMLSLAVPVNTQFSASAATYPTPPAGIEVWNGKTTEVTAENNTYNVSTAEQLAWALKSKLKIKKINLTEDIYLNDLTNFDSWNSTTEGLHNWTSTELPDPDTFCRVEIQGNNHTIYGLYDVNTTGNAGLIHNFTDDWPNHLICYNLGIDYAYISGKNSGAFVATYNVHGDQRDTDIVFENCFVGENVIIDCPADSIGAGGFVGYTSRLYNFYENKKISFKNCYSLVNIKNSGNVTDAGYGAFCGNTMLKPITMEHCYTNQSAMFGYITPYQDGPDKDYGIVDPTINYSPEALKKGSSYYTTACPIENMKGITAAISMANLGAAYVTTDGYPILEVFNKDSKAVPLGTLGTTYFAGGKGTEAEPFLISTEEHLKNALDLFGANLHYKLTNDIYVEAEKWYAATSPDGYTNSKGVVGAFSGTLDGDGYAVHGICYPRQSQWESDELYTFYAGFIPIMGNGAVKNLTIADSYMSVTYRGSNTAVIGTVAGKITGTVDLSSIMIEDTVTNEVLRTSERYKMSHSGVVGIAGDNSTINFTDIGVYANIKDDSGLSAYASGLVSDPWNSTLTVTNCFTKGVAAINKAAKVTAMTLTNVFSNQATKVTSPDASWNYGSTNVMSVVDDLTLATLTSAGFDADNWYSGEGNTPMLRIRGEAIADVDENGVGLEDGDFAALRKHLLDVEEKLNSDVNRNGEVDILDLVVLKQRMSGHIR